MDYATAEFICWLDVTLTLEEIIDFVKALTWEHEVEVAVLRVRGHGLAVVSGGKIGIELGIEDGAPYDLFGNPARWATVRTDAGICRVDQLVLHTHPMPTGPSDWDRDLLSLLGQSESWIYEIGDPHGTRFTPKLLVDDEGDYQ